MRRAVVSAVFVGGNAALYEYFRRAWWSGERADHIFINWETHESFREQDKLGHALGGYHLTRMGDQLLHAACVSEPRAVWFAAGYAAAFQLQIELWDGMQKAYGFSPTDLMANTAGAALGVGQVYSSRLRRVKPTISYNATYTYRHRNEYPLGSAASQLRPTVDYSGQTYWASFEVDSMLPPRIGRYWPRLLRASVGHSITDFRNVTTGADQWARRKWVVSIDLDPEAIPGSNRIWRRALHELSYYHFPSPALVLTPRVHGTLWYQ